jgi:hypothetical protein
MEIDCVNDRYKFIIITENLFTFDCSFPKIQTKQIPYEEITIRMHTLSIGV